MNDIDAENVAWRSISSSSSNPFKGNFDGNGYCIFNLEYMANNYGYGIFGYLKEASIHDLGIKVKTEYKFQQEQMQVFYVEVEAHLPYCVVM